MKLWNLVDPSDFRFAYATRIGTWIEQGDPPKSVRVQPLVIEWEPSSTLVGDFIWAVPEYMVKRTIGEEILAAGFNGFELGPVEMIPNDNHKRRQRKMIQLPYEGPELVDFWVAKWVPLNRERSTIRLVGHPDAEPVFELEGDEHIEHGEWDSETAKLERVRVPRTPDMGAYVDAYELDDCDVFKVNELSSGIVCTDRLRDFIIDKGYSNITFHEVGETID